MNTTRKLEILAGAGLVGYLVWTKLNHNTDPEITQPVGTTKRKTATKAPPHMLPTVTDQQGSQSYGAVGHQPSDVVKSSDQSNPSAPISTPPRVYTDNTGLGVYSPSDLVLLQNASYTANDLDTKKAAVRKFYSFSDERAREVFYRDLPSWDLKNAIEQTYGANVTDKDGNIIAVNEGFARWLQKWEGPASSVIYDKKTGRAFNTNTQSQRTEELF